MGKRPAERSPLTHISRALLTPPLLWIFRTLAWSDPSSELTIHQKGPGPHRPSGARSICHAPDVISLVFALVAGKFCLLIAGLLAALLRHTLSRRVVQGPARLGAAARGGVNPRPRQTTKNSPTSERPSILAAHWHTGKVRPAPIPESEAVDGANQPYKYPPGVVHNARPWTLLANGASPVGPRAAGLGNQFRIYSVCYDAVQLLHHGMLQSSGLGLPSCLACQHLLPYPPPPPCKYPVVSAPSGGFGFPGYHGVGILKRSRSASILSDTTFARTPQQDSPTRTSSGGEHGPCRM
jgi:hypothetical protein